MARPRKQTYTLEMYLKKIKDGDIDNCADVQRHMVWTNEQINELIVTVLTDEYIPPIILGEESNSQLHIADGGCRSAALNSFWNGTHKITPSIECSIIPYKKKVKKEDGSINWEDATFDIKNKTIDKLPEELKKKFCEYQIETVIHENCDKNKISKYIKRYNNHTSMNADQKAFTYIDKFAGNIRDILNSKFFLDYSNYSENDKIKGVIERVVLETVMCTNHFDKWNKQPKVISKYLNNHATKEQFDNLLNNLHRLEIIITDDIKDLFNKKDSFIFLTLFDKFKRFGLEDEKFAEFLKEFKFILRKSKKNNNGFLFDEIKQNNSTKSRQVISDKLDMLESLMLEFLHISNEEKKEIIHNEVITAKDIIEEYVSKNAEDDEIELYEMIANDVSEVIDDIDSDFLSDANRPSFVALVAYADYINKTDLLSNWLICFEKKKNLILNQKKNFLHMKKDFDQYCKEENSSV